MATQEPMASILTNYSIDGAALLLSKKFLCQSDITISTSSQIYSASINKEQFEAAKERSDSRRGSLMRQCDESARDERSMSAAFDMGSRAAFDIGSSAAFDMGSRAAFDMGSSAFDMGSSIDKSSVGKSSVGKRSVGKSSVGKRSVGKSSVGKSSDMGYGGEKRKRGDEEGEDEDEEGEDGEENGEENGDDEDYHDAKGSSIVVDEELDELEKLDDCFGLEPDKQLSSYLLPIIRKCSSLVQVHKASIDPGSIFSLVTIVNPTKCRNLLTYNPVLIDSRHQTKSFNYFDNLMIIMGIQCKETINLIRRTMKEDRDSHLCTAFSVAAHGGYSNLFHPLFDIKLLPRKDRQKPKFKKMRQEQRLISTISIESPNETISPLISAKKFDERQQHHVFIKVDETPLTEPHFKSASGEGTPIRELWRPLQRMLDQKHFLSKPMDHILCEQDISDFVRKAVEESILDSKEKYTDELTARRVELGVESSYQYYPVISNGRRSQTPSGQKIQERILNKCYGVEDDLDSPVQINIFLLLRKSDGSFIFYLILLQ